MKIHIREQPATFERFRVQWTPTFLVLDSGGVERHRFEGFHAAEDLLAQLELGLAHLAFGNQDWAAAERRFRQVVDAYPATEAAPAALYWAGVAKYKGSGDAAALAETAARFKERYPASSWAQKASVWG